LSAKLTSFSKPEQVTKHEVCAVSFQASTLKHMSSKAKTTFDVDVAVVGGGPGGLATAAAIHAACNEDVRVEVQAVHGIQP